MKPNFGPLSLGVGTLSLLSASTCTSQIARADVAWQHSITVRAGQNLRVGSKADVKMTLLNEWSGLRHRSVVRTKSSDMQNLPPFSLPGQMMPQALMQSFQPASGAIAKSARAQNPKTAGATIDIVSITDREADTFSVYGAPKRTYIQEPLKATLKRVRFDPWKKLAPRLSEDAPEPLSARQRERLGAEVRAIYTPLLKKTAKLYFRAMPGTRTVAGVEGRIYRLTALVNTGTKQRPAWAQMRAQWVIANELPGDEEVRAFQKSSRELLREVGWPSSSMWINEVNPIFYQMLPQEIHQSIESLAPREGMAREFFAGTPLEMFVTLVPPPLERRLGGEVRVNVVLESRSTDALAATNFAIPAGYTRTPLEPQLKEYDKAMGMLADRINDSPISGMMMP